MAAFLEKSTGSEGFHQVIDFLSQSHISYALTKKPDIYISFIKQFWRTAEASTDTDGEVTITAIIDGQSKTITEASLRRHLKLEDHDGITSIPNSEIFEQLALMGYQPDSDKLTFQKGVFSPQWRFLIHTLLHCLSPKKTAWEQFSSNIATALICLATNRKYNFSRLIFEHMVTNIGSPHKFLMYPRITSSPSPTPSPSPSPEPTPAHTPSPTQPSPTQPSPTQPSPTQPSPTQPGTEHHLPTPYDSPLHAVHSHGSDEGSLKLQELMNLVTTLSDRIGVLEADLMKTKKTYNDEEVQEKASTDTELFIQEVTPTEVIQDQEGSKKASDEVSTAGAKKGTASEEVPIVSTAEVVLIYLVLLIYEVTLPNPYSVATHFVGVTPQPSKTSPFVDDDLDEEEAIKVTKKKNLENDIEDEILEIDEIVNIKESRNHQLENVIGNLNQRTLRSQAQNQSNFFCFISTIEPKNMNEALGDESWIVAIQEELNQFIANNVWELVAQGYNQQEGIDYDETYAPVARLESIRILLAYACALDFKLFQMDVKSAFLNGFINEEVYVAQPPGFIDFEKPDHVYKLKKALYGLKQAPKACVCLCTRFQEAPKTSHLEAVKRIFRYIKGTTHLGLWYPKGTNMEIVVYADSDHVRDYVDQKSTSSICTFVGCYLTSWFSKKQTALAISTTEAEYVSAEKACQQALWMKHAQIDYDVRLDKVPIMCDNKGAIDVNPN
ncbi:retrovirus-related pol polyprotein from transposon TNT 1-94 [Tanacetum coccineum]